jgi:WD40 repeat protein
MKEPDGKVIPFQAVKSGSVEFMTRLNDDDNRLLCWSNLPSNDEVFIICTKQEDDFKVMPFSISLDARLNPAEMLRPLRIWDELNLIAITHTDHTLTIWLWDETTGDLSLQAKLVGHTGFVTDIERLDNDIFVTSSEDKTIRAWKYDKKLNGFSPYKKFMGDYSFTKLLLLNDDISEQIVAGDEMGIVHLIKCS